VPVNCLNIRFRKSYKRGFFCLHDKGLTETLSDTPCILVSLPSFFSKRSVLVHSLWNTELPSNW